MRIISVTFIVVLSAQFGMAQLNGRLTTVTGEPVPFANVVLLNAIDSAFVKGTVTTDSGAFIMNDAPNGTYFIRYSAVGFQPYNSPAFELHAGKNKTLDTQVLEEDAQLLEEVTIQAEKPLVEQLIDRTVVNVENSVMTKGSSALQVLERSPGVFVDMRNNTISLNGRGNVLVLLNGKTMRLPVAQVVAMLNGMSANDIEKIELIATPPANYDADGTGGIINIVMKKQDEVGTTASASLTAGYGWGEKGTASVNVSHNTGTVNLYGGYSFFRNRTTDGWDATGGQNMPLFGGKLLVDAGSHPQSASNSHDGSLGLDLHLGKTNIGGSVRHLVNYDDREVSNYGRYYIITADSLLVMDAGISGRSKWTNTITNLYLERHMREGRKLNIDLDYVGYHGERPSDGKAFFYNASGDEVHPEGAIFSNRQLTTATVVIHVGVLKADYTNPINDNITWTSGIKGTFTGSSSLSSIRALIDDEWTTSPRYQNDTNMGEVIGAAYTSLSWQITPSLGLSAGVRYEYSQTYNEGDKEENEIDRKIAKLFPSVFLSKKLNEDLELQLSYTKRISRPAFNDLTSYLMYIDPMSVGTGNPSLHPTITNNVRAGINYKGYTFSLLASRDDHPIVLYQVSESPAGDIMYNNPQNMAYQNNLTLQTDLPFALAPWWTMNLSLSGSLRQFKLSHTKEKLVKTYVTATLNGRQSFTLPKNFSLEISGWFNAVQYDGSKRLDGFGMLNAGISKELKNNGGTLQLGVEDLLKSMKVSGHFGTITNEVFGLYADFIYKAESANYRIVRLSYTRSFGNSKAHSRRRSSVSDDERKRIR